MDTLKLAVLSPRKIISSSRRSLGKDLKNFIKSSDCTDDSPSSLQTLLQKEEKHYRSQCLQGLESILFAEEGEKPAAILNWFTTMTEWCFTVVDNARLPAETVETAMNIVDRYLLSTCVSYGTSPRRSISLSPKDNSIFRSLSQLKRLVVTCLHIASKSNNGYSRSLSRNVLEKLSRKEVKARDIETMEMKVLFTVKSQTNPPTIVSYAKEIQKQLQLWNCDNNEDTTTTNNNEEVFLLLVEKQARLAMTKLYTFHTSRPSIALACVKNALLVMEAQSLQVEGSTDRRASSLSSSSVQKSWRKLEKEIRRSSGMEKHDFFDAHYRLQYKLRTVARQAAFEWKEKNRDSDDSSSTYPDESWSSGSIDFSGRSTDEYSSISLTPIRELGKAS